jgi:hypothetical protein
MASRIVDQLSAASKQQNAPFVSRARVPFNFGEVRPLAPGEKSSWHPSPGLVTVPLSEPLETKLEMGAVNNPLGYDFSRVRVHSDEPSSTAAHAVKALANTAVIQRAPEVKTDPGATCSLDQHRKIEPAAYKADEWLSRTIPALEAFMKGARTPQAKVAAASLNKHFHSMDAAVVRYVGDRLKTIQNDIFGRRNFRVNCPPASDPACGTRKGSEEFVAVVPEGNPNEINFCAPFFERKEEDRASTIIHEFGHTQLGLSARQQIVDRGYQWDAYYTYLTTGEALTNAESYAMFAREVATGFSPAQGFISDSLEECPDAWIPIISDAITKARMWNRKAALNTPARHEFSRAYKTLDAKLKSDFTFKCIPDGGGRCRDRNVAYWYAAGDLRICPGLIGLASPEERSLAMLAALYAYESLVDGNDRQDRAASEAQRLHSANVPSTADVLSGS